MRRPSSRQVIAALKADGFDAPRPPKGSHQAFQKLVDGRTRTVVVIVGKSEIPPGTMRSIRAQWGIDEDTFEALLRHKRS